MTPPSKVSVQAPKRKAKEAAKTSRPKKASKLQHVETLKVEEPQTDNATIDEDDLEMSRTASPGDAAPAAKQQPVVIEVDDSQQDTKEAKQEQTLCIIEKDEQPPAKIAASSDQADLVVLSSQNSAKKAESTPFPCFEEDRSKDMRYYYYQQLKLNDLVPKKAYLAPHRCWIAVIDGAKKVTAANVESTVLWMKGNRSITAETVMRHYETATLSDEVALVSGRALVRKKDTMKEWFFNNERLVVFRAFPKDCVSMYAQRLTTGLIPRIPKKPEQPPTEVVDLDRAPEKPEQSPPEIIEMDHVPKEPEQSPPEVVIELG